MSHAVHSAMFLLSPAYSGGRRAAMLMKPGSRLEIAQRLNAGTLMLGEAFTFMSGLYFRGKAAYARAFGRAPVPRLAGAYVITPTRGLLPLDTPVSRAMLEEFSGIDLSLDDQRFRRPLGRDLGELARALHPHPHTRVVLLGSIATSKYVTALADVLGDRLHYPPAFIGRGDMSRGGLLLRAADALIELDYAVLKPQDDRRGPRPPKLPPLRRLRLERLI